jgi:hypothetical protein
MPAYVNNYSTQPLNYIPSAIQQVLPATAPRTNTIENSTVFSFLDSVGINKRVLDLLSTYSQLQDNWDEEDGLAPDQTALAEATQLAQTLQKAGQKVFHADPGPNGEIMLDLRNENGIRSLELIFYPNKTIAVKFPETGDPSQEIFEQQTLPGLLEWLNKR